MNHRMNNQHGNRERPVQRRFTVNVCTGIAAESLVEPYNLPPRLDARKYIVIIQEDLLEMLNDVRAHV